MTRFAPAAALLFLGCPSSPSDPPGDDDDAAFVPGDDDDVADDDDAVDDDDAADDDDDAVDPGPSYPVEEQWFALGVGHRWRYQETVDAEGGEPVVDDVIVQIVSRRAGPDLAASWGADVAAFEFLVDRALGPNTTHWYGIDGTGVMKWLRTIQEDPFGDRVTEGDGGVVFRLAATDPELEGAEYDSAWFLPDVDGFDYSATTSTTGSHLLPNGQFIDALENEVSEGGSVVGVQRVRGRWGLLGFELSLGGAGVEWDVRECSVCPASAEL